MTIIYIIGMFILGCFVGLVIIYHYCGDIGKIIVGALTDWIKRNNPFKIL